MSTDLHLQRSATGEKKSTSDNITPTLDKDAENGLVVDQDNGTRLFMRIYRIKFIVGRCNAN
jgi:hypothetical protein